MHVMTAHSHRERWDRFAVPLPGEPTCIVASRGSDADEDVLHAQLVSLYGRITRLSVVVPGRLQQDAVDQGVRIHSVKIRVRAVVVGVVV